MNTAPGVCVLGWVKYREHISLLVILCIILYVTKKIKNNNIFLQNRYPNMVKCLNIGKNIGKPIYRSISSLYCCIVLFWFVWCFSLVLSLFIYLII